MELETFPGTLTPFAIHKKNGAKEAKEHINGTGRISFWMDDSRLDFGRTGASVAWREPKWKTQKTYLSINKGVFDAELYEIGKAVKIAQCGRQT